MCLNSTSTKPVRQVSAFFHLLECVYGLVKLSQQSSRPQPLAGVHRLHSVQAILVSAGKHGMSGYPLVLLEYLDRMNTIIHIVFYIFSALDGRLNYTVLQACFPNHVEDIEDCHIS